MSYGTTGLDGRFVAAPPSTHSSASKKVIERYASELVLDAAELSVLQDRGEDLREAIKQVAKKLAVLRGYYGC